MSSPKQDKSQQRSKLTWSTAEVSTAKMGTDEPKLYQIADLVSESGKGKKTLVGCNVNNSIANKNYDLSGWKYSELRDTINTSNDVEFWGACRQEFNRRLKVYHAWKARSNSKNDGEPTAARNSRGSNEMQVTYRAPKIVYQYQHIDPTSAPSDRQHFFRVPYTEDDQNKGLWYAHFDGQFIARQMEIHPGRKITLMIAGRDDMQMCELKLNETGLMPWQGFEIIEYEFEKEWSKHGGDRYTRPSERASLANK